MQFINPKYKGENKGHYSAGVLVEGILYVSGQLSLDPDTREVCKGDVRAHTRQALANVERVLKEAGLERKHVFYCRIYTPKAEYWDDINAEYAEFFGDHKPGRIIVTTGELHFGCLVEIEAMADLP